MATATKTARSLIASTSNAATETEVGALNLSTAFGALLTAKVTNGATGPTAGCDVIIKTSTDNSNWFTYTELLAGTGNNGVYEWAVDLPATVMYVQVTMGNNTDQAVTVECLAQEFTSFA